MEKIEDILDQALLDLKNGLSTEEIFSKWPKHELELKQLLSVAEQFNSLPKNNIPAPVMQRKYLQVPIKTHAWFAWVHMSRWVNVSIGAVLLIAGFATTAYGAARSLPGQTLFPIRKTAEKIQLHFAKNDIERANIQLKITQERLADAQVVFSSPDSSSEQQAAALDELASQTGTALQTVKSATDNNNQDQSPIVASLNKISSKQQELIETINSVTQSDSTTTASSAVATLLAAAADEQRVLISLNQKTSSTPATSTATSDSLVVAVGTEAPPLLPHSLLKRLLIKRKLPPPRNKQISRFLNRPRPLGHLFQKTRPPNFNLNCL